MAALLRRASCCTATTTAPSYIIGLGDYTGGSLWIYDPTYCLSFLLVRSSSALSRRAVLAAGTLAPPVTCCQSWLARGWQLPTSGAQPKPQRTFADYAVASRTRRTEKMVLACLHATSRDSGRLTALKPKTVTLTTTCQEHPANRTVFCVVVLRLVLPKSTLLAFLATEKILDFCKQHVHQRDREHVRTSHAKRPFGLLKSSDRSRPSWPTGRN